MNKIVEFLNKLASTESECDAIDFYVYEYAGGNLDDAYSIGREHGRTSLARELVKMIDELG